MKAMNMSKIKTFLLGIVGRFKHMLAEVIAQYGAALLALSAVIAVFAYGERGNLSTAPLWILAIILFGMGAYAFHQSLERSKQEVRDRHSENTLNELRERKIIVLLSAMAKDRGVDTDKLLNDEENKMRQEIFKRTSDKVKRGDIL